MTEFLDGPLKGATLMLRRSPPFLRATRKAVDGKYVFDALDQLEDTPEAKESLSCYYRVADDGWLHLKMQGKGSGTYRRATYALYTIQPDDTTMRDTRKWRAWCLAESQKALPKE